MLCLKTNPLFFVQYIIGNAQAFLAIIKSIWHVESSNVSVTILIQMNRNVSVCIFTDINECLLTPRPCLAGQCENTVGSFQCVCPSGYRSNAQQNLCSGQCVLTISLAVDLAPILFAVCLTTWRVLHPSHRCVLAVEQTPAWLYKSRSQPILKSYFLMGI